MFNNSGFNLLSYTQLGSKFSTQATYVLLHHTGTLEMFQISFPTLNPGVFDLANLQKSEIVNFIKKTHLLRIEFLPLLIMILSIEVLDLLVLNQIDKCVSDIAFVLKKLAQGKGF